MDNNVVEGYSDLWPSVTLSLIDFTHIAFYISDYSRTTVQNVEVLTIPGWVRYNPEPTVIWKIPLKFVLGIYLWHLHFSTVLTASIEKTNIIQRACLWRQYYKLSQQQETGEAWTWTSWENSQSAKSRHDMRLLDPFKRNSLFQKRNPWKRGRMSIKCFQYGCLAPDQYLQCMYVLTT